MRLRIFGYAAAMVVLVAAGGARADDGQAVYNQNCGACHNAMSPKLGDREAWASRIKLGTDALVASVVKGKGMMPARGGHANLSNADIKAAVEYIESKAQ